MGTRGPAPKPEHARLRKNKYPEVTRVVAGQRTEAPFEADPKWHPVAVEFWEAFQDSPQTQVWEMTDWMKCYTLCEQLSRELEPQFVGWVETWNSEAQVMEKKPARARVPMKGATLTALGAWMTTLGTTRADRLRMQVELHDASSLPAGPPDPNDATGVVVTGVDFGRKTS